MLARFAILLSCVFTTIAAFSEENECKESLFLSTPEIIGKFSMFKWSHEFETEVDIPVDMVWEFYTTISNWPKWIPQFESCSSDGELKIGSVIKSKVKERNFSIDMLITELTPNSSFSLVAKQSLFVQNSTCEIRGHSGKTRIIFRTSVKSLLVPFMKSYFQKRVDLSNAKSIDILLESYQTSKQDRKI